MELRKGLSCKDCFNCLSRTFRERDKLINWIVEKEVDQAEQFERWERLLATVHGTRLYWCKLEAPIEPVSTPPWWKKDSTVGCLRENV